MPLPTLPGNRALLTPGIRARLAIWRNEGNKHAAEAHIVIRLSLRGVFHQRDTHARPLIPTSHTGTDDEVITSARWPASCHPAGCMRGGAVLRKSIANVLSAPIMGRSEQEPATGRLRRDEWLT